MLLTMSKPEKDSEKRHLRKEMNLPLLMFMIIGLNIGGALFTITSSSAALTGPALILAQIITAIPVLLAIRPYMVMTSIAPKTAANYQYGKLASYPLAVASPYLLLIGGAMGGVSLFAFATAKYMLILMPGVPEMAGWIHWDTLIAIIILTIFYIINVSGIKETAWSQFVFTGCMLAALVTLVIVGLKTINMDNFSPFFVTTPINFLAGCALIYVLLGGGLYGIDFGEEVKNPHSVIPKAIMISMIIVIVIYMLVDFVVLGNVSWQTFAKGNLGTAAKLFLPPGVWIFFIIGGGILAPLTSLHATLGICGRYIMASAQDGFLPRPLATISTRGTPAWGLTVAYLLSLITLLFVRNITVFGTLLNFGILFGISLAMFAAFRLPKKYPQIFSRTTIKTNPAVLSGMSITACVLNLFLMVGLIALMFMQGQAWSFWLFVIAIIAALIVYNVRKRQGALKPLDIEDYK